MGAGAGAAVLWEGGAPALRKRSERPRTAAAAANRRDFIPAMMPPRGSVTTLNIPICPGFKPQGEISAPPKNGGHVHGVLVPAPGVAGLCYTPGMKKPKVLLLGLSVSALLAGLATPSAAQSRGIEHGQRYDRLVIRNVILIDGKGTPARGPLDVIVEGNRIAAVRGADLRPEAYKGETHVLDGSGMYLLPGLIDSHIHLHDERAG